MDHRARLAARASWRGSTASTVERDEAGNTWATAPGDSDRFVIVGGHLDSVPDGGWLDGTLNVVGGPRGAARARARASAPLTLKLVDWADEEGARFGRSLLGSSACAGSLDPDSVRGLTDRDGTALPDALAAHGVELDRMRESRRAARGRAAYLELHIEQGPGARALDLPLGVVLGTFGVQRHTRALHRRARARGRDADGPAPRRVPRRRAQRARLARGRRRARRRARDHRHRARLARDRDRVQRHLRGVARPARARRRRAGRHARRPRRRDAERIAAEEGCEVAWEQVWEIEPIPFDAELIDLADAVVAEVAGTSHRLPERPAARCRRDGARDADRDAVRQEPRRRQPHQGGGHAGRGPRAVGARARTSSRGARWRGRRSAD